MSFKFSSPFTTLKIKVSKSEIRHSAQILNTSPLTQNQTAQLRPTSFIHFPKSYLVSNLCLKDERALSEELHGLHYISPSSYDNDDDDEDDDDDDDDDGDDDYYDDDNNYYYYYDDDNNNNYYYYDGDNNNYYYYYGDNNNNSNNNKRSASQ